MVSTEFLRFIRLQEILTSGSIMVFVCQFSRYFQIFTLKSIFLETIIPEMIPDFFLLHLNNRPPRTISNKIYKISYILWLEKSLKWEFWNDLKCTYYKQSLKKNNKICSLRKIKFEDFAEKRLYAMTKNANFLGFTYVKNSEKHEIWVSSHQFYLLSMLSFSTCPPLAEQLFHENDKNMR